MWATERQIAQLFGRDRTVFRRHIRNSFKEGELEEIRTSAIFALVRMEGGREIEIKVQHYIHMSLYCLVTASKDPLQLNIEYFIEQSKYQYGQRKHF